MPLRIAFDMDGVLADFSRAFRQVESRLLGPESRGRVGEAGREEEQREAHARRTEQSEQGALLDYDSEIAPDRGPERSRSMNRPRSTQRSVWWRPGAMSCP